MDDLIVKIINKLKEIVWNYAITKNPVGLHLKYK